VQSLAGVWLTQDAGSVLPAIALSLAGRSAAFRRSSIVHHDHFEIGKLLCEHRIERTSQRAARL